jgi:phosphoribosylglycinamide formyltransferase 1
MAHSRQTARPQDAQVATAGRSVWREQRAGAGWGDAIAWIVPGGAPGRERPGILAAVAPRIAVLASGSGTNLQALLEDPWVGPLVTLVVSDRGDAGALHRARASGVKEVHLDPGGYPGRRDHDRALLELLQGEAIDIVCLAGYMRILSPLVVRAFWGRMVNVHPALLPAFPGAHAVRDALAWGVKVTGVTVHLVDEQVDHGPIVAQEPVPVKEGDDEAGLYARIQAAEHRLYPRVVRALAEGRVRVEGRRVLVGDSPS